MNLDELQIKISIELDDLNKQLKTVTKGIDKALGPKTTKKLMADNNKIIKSGLNAINKTTLNLVKKSRKDTTKEIEAMSKDITKTLNKAFDVSFTKLNSNITSAMNQAKMTVRSACNDIRRELNAALNIKGNIRVTSKTSITGSATGSSGSNAASSISSSQYIGAMIIKATNAVIANNNANTTRLEHAIDNLGNKLTSAIKGMNININNDDVVKAINNLGKKGSYRVKPRKPQQQEQEENLSAVIPQETKAKPKKKIQMGTKSNGIPTKYSKVDSGIFFTLEQLNHKVNFILGEVTDTGAFLKALQEALKQSVKATNRYHRFMDDISKSINIKRLGTGSYGSNQLSGSPINFAQGGTSPLDTSQIEAMKKAFEYMQNIRKQSRIPALNEPIEDYEASEFAAKELHRQVASLMDMAQELDKAFHQTPIGINEAVQQANFLEGALDAVLDASKDLTSLSPQIAKSFEFARDVLNKMAPGIRALANEIRSYTKPQAPAGIPMDLEEYDLNPPRPETPKIVEDIKKEMQDAKDIKDKIQDVKDEMQEMLKALSGYKDIEIGPEELSEFRNQVEDLMKSCKSLKIDMESLKVDVDDEDLEDAERKLKGYQHVLVQVKKDLEKVAKNPKAVSNIDTDIYERMVHNPPTNIVDSGDGGTLGFLPYKNQIDALIEYAKKAGIRIKEALFNSNSQNLGFAPYQNELHELGELAKRIGSVIKEKLSNAFSSIKGFNLGNFNFNQAFDSHVAVHQAGEIKAKLGEIKAKYKETASEINSIASKLTAPFKKLGSIAYKGISSGLNKAKTALDKFANGCKSSWAKITGIFRKGSNDCGKAMSPLRSSLSSLVSMFGLYQLGSIFIDGTKQAIKYEASLMTIQRTLGGASKALIDFANNNAQAFGISKSQVMEFGNIFSVIVSNFEKDGTKVAGTTQKLLESAGIIAGATGYDVNQVLENLRSGILGSSEAVDQLGLNLKVASLEASESFRQIANGAKSWNDLTEAQKQAIIAQEIINQTTAKYGGIVKNTSSMHNAFIAQLNNTKLALGKLGKALYTAILPALTTIMAVLEKVFTYAAQVVTSILSVFGITVDFASNIQPPDDSLGESVGESFDDTKESVDDATEAVEKFKGSLAGFDEINILSDNTPKTEKPEVPDDGGIGDIGEIGTPEFSEGEGMFDKLGEKFKAFIDEVLEPFKKAWELLGDDLIAEWEDLKESFKHFCDSLGKFLVSVWEHGGKEFVQHMAEIGLACAIAAMEIGGEILDSLARLWDHLDPAKNMNTQGFLNALNEVSVKLRDFILGLGDHFESLMANGGQDVLNSMGDCFMNLGEAATRGFGVAIDALDGFIDHLDPAVNENTKNMLQSLADMFHAVGQTSLDFVSLLESCLVNGGQNMINAFGDMMMNMGQATSEVITTIMTSFSELFEYLDPATNEITKNMMKAWEDAFLAIGESSLAFSDLFESIMLNGGQEVLNKLGDAFNSLVGLVGTIVEEIADALTGLYEHLDPKTNEFTQNMLKNWQTAFENISDLCDTLGETLGSIMDNGGQDLLNSLGDLVMQISGTFGQLVGIVADSMSKFFEHMDPGKNSASKGAIDALTYTIDSIRDFIDVFGDSVQYFLDNGGQDFINNLGDIIALIADLGFTIAGDVISSITTFFDSWAGHLLIAACGEALEIVSTVLEALLELLEPLTPLLSGLLAGFAAFKVSLPIIGFITKLVAGFKTLAGAGGIVAVAKTALSGLWAILAANPIAATVAAIVGIGVALVACYNKFEWFRTIIDTVFGPLNKAFEAIVDTVIKVFDDVVDIFRNIIDIIVGIFTGDGQKVGNAVRELCGNILKLFGDIVVGIADIGWNIITGLVEGIWNGIKAIPSLLAGIGEFVVDFFKGLFGIHSPSTVFAEIGVNLIEGLVEGIVSMIGAISEGWQKIGDAIFDAITGIVTNSIENWGKLGKAIFDSLGDIYDNVSEKWGEIKENVSDKCKDIYEDTKEKWTNIKDKTIEIASNLKEKAEEKYTQLKDKLTDTTDKWRQNSEDKWSKVKSKTEELTTNLKNTVEDKYGKFRDALTNTMENWRANSEDKWSKIKSKTTELVSNLKSDAETKYNTMKENLTSKLETWRSTSESKWNNIKSKTTELVGNLKSDVEQKYETLKSNLGSKMENLKSDMQTKWENIKSKTTELVNSLKSEAEKKYGELKTNLGTKLEEVKNEASSKWESIKTTTSTKVREVVDEATKKYGEMKSSFTKKMDEVKTALGPKWTELKNSVKTNASGIASKVSEGLSNVKQKFTKPFEDAKKAVGEVINSIGRTFKNANWSFPKIKLPHIKITGKWSFNPPSVPSFGVEWRKRGGIIDGITPLGFANGALQMGGEAGKEMVVPLENTSFTSKIAQAMGQAVDNAMARQSNPYNNAYNVIDDKRDIVLKINDREFARASINSINKLQRESGRTLLDI